MDMGDIEMELYVCDLCNSFYSSEKSLKLHHRCHKALTCEVCQKVFYIRNDFKAHCKVHKNKILKRATNIKRNNNDG